MKRFHSILAQIDTSRTLQPVLDTAIVVARRHEAALTVVDIVPEFTWPARLTVPRGEELRGVLAEQKRRRLAEITAPYADKGLRISTRVLMGRTSARLVEEVQAGGHDLVLRLTKGVHSRRTGLLGTTGLQLLRNCPCTVWLVKPEQRTKPAHIAAAVDVGSASDEHRKLNARILETAASVAEMQEGMTLDVVYAWSIYGENVLREHLKPEEFAELERTTLADHQLAMDQLLAAQQVELDAERIHLVRGDASHVLPQFVQQSGVDLLVMGTVARRGAAGWLLGNTAERVFDKVNCSLLAVKPQDDAVET